MDTLKIEVKGKVVWGVCHCGYKEIFEAHKDFIIPWDEETKKHSLKERFICPICSTEYSNIEGIENKQNYNNSFTLFKKKTFLILSSLLIAFSIIFAIEFFENRFNDKEIALLNNEFSSNKDFDKYFTSIFVSEAIGKPDDSYVYKIYPYQVLAGAKEEFLSLKDTEKLEVLVRVAEIIKKHIDDYDDYIDCGGDNRCDIKEIVVLDNEDGEDRIPESYSIEFNKNFSIVDYTMKVAYYKNGIRETKSVQIQESVTESSSTPTKKAPQSNPLSIENTSCSRSSNYIYAKGYVKNNTDQTLTYIEIKADVVNSSGEIIDTNYTYAVGSEGLSPGSRKSYEIMIPYDDSVNQCKYYIVDYKY